MAHARRRRAGRPARDARVDDDADCVTQSERIMTTKTKRTMRMTTTVPGRFTPVSYIWQLQLSLLPKTTTMQVLSSEPYTISYCKLLLRRVLSECGNYNSTSMY